MFGGWLSGSGRLKPNSKNQPRCINFERLEAAVRGARHQRKQETNPVKLHPSYDELEKCARNGCTGCRVIRHGVLVAQITSRQVQRIEQGDDPIYVRLMQDQDSQAQGLSMLQVIVGVPHECLTSINIALTTNLKCPMLPEKRFDLVVPQIKLWLETCRSRHEAQCGNLCWSMENPRRLIELISDTEAKLIDASNLPKLDYVALSYCWGDGGLRGNTTWENLQERQHPFSIWELPETIRDSLILVQRLGLRYVWVDQVCIVQPTETANGEDWDLEGSRMHIVYGNAVFTLNACSSEASTDGLFRPRKAWTYPIIPFYLEGQWLVNFETTLKEIRARAPLSSRAWCLQEERLSPRQLYFCGQRLYWSCSVEQRTEAAVHGEDPGAPAEQPFAHRGEYEGWSDAQAFLMTRFEGNKAKLHNEWQDLVEAYCLRNMTKASDRFRAVSGLAAQYLRVYLNKDNQFGGQEYIAGLWRATFVEDLAWSVRTAGDIRSTLLDFAPSWSWASLPLQTRINMKEPFERIHDFRLLEKATITATSGAESDAGAVVLEACRKGADKRIVLIEGRLQRLMNSIFKQVEWSQIQATRDSLGDNVYGSLSGYVFSNYIDQHIYARNDRTGQIVIHEPTKRSMEGQLDYLAPLDEMSASEPYIATGRDTELEGLQIGRTTMLLLLAVPSSGHHPLYRRVGICRNVRDAFFDGVEPVRLELM